MTTANLHRRLTNNVGDLMCAPSLYFPEIAGSALEIMGFKEGDHGLSKDQWRERFDASDNFVIGGGGLLGSDYFAPALRFLFENKRKEARVVVWGAGHNNWQLKDWRLLKQSLADVSEFHFDLVGVRDYNQGFAWVPCASCMHPIFDSTPEPVHDVVLYAHTGTMKRPHLAELLPKGVPTLANDAPFEDAVAFIASGDLVLTDSFHGLYWATLMGRRVVAFPSSSKFYSVKHPAPLCDPSDWMRFVPLAQRYPEALAECRDANTRFAAQVAELFEPAPRPEPKLFARLGRALNPLDSSKN